jgi:hypothetical protein
MRVSGLALVISFSFVASLAACAPRSGKTHFDRWADQTQKRKEEEALEVKEKEWLRAQIAHGGGATHSAQSGGASMSSPGDAPRSQNTPSNYSSLGGSGVARTSTGTKSRVIKPSDAKPSDEDEAIY